THPSLVRLCSSASHAVFFYSYRHLPHLHPFPTRRSSDMCGDHDDRVVAQGQAQVAVQQRMHGAAGTAARTVQARQVVDETQRDVRAERVEDHLQDQRQRDPRRSDAEGQQCAVSATGAGTGAGPCGGGAHRGGHRLWAFVRFCPRPARDITTPAMSATTITTAPTAIAIMCPSTMPKAMMIPPRTSPRLRVQAATVLPSLWGGGGGTA